MPRTLPTPPFTGLDATIYSPYAPVIGHDDDAPERHWRPIARWLNAGLAEGHAGTVASMSWADGQAASDDADWADKIDLDVPPAPSDSHTRLVVSMVVEPDASADPADAGLIRVRDGAIGGAFSVIVPPAFDAGGAELREVELLAATPGGAVLDVDAIGRVHVRSLECRWLPFEGVGGELAGALIGVDPLDDDDVRPDDFGHSQTFVAIYEAIRSVQGRHAGRLTAAGWGTPLARRPLRAIAPVPQGGSQLVVKLRVANPDAEVGAAVGHVWIQHGRGGSGVVIEGRYTPYVHQEDVDFDTPLETRTVVLDLADRLRVPSVGPEYPGSAHLAVFAEGVDLYAVTAWSK